MPKLPRTDEQKAARRLTKEYTQRSRTRGRPAKHIPFRKSYANDVIEFCRKGFSLSAFCGHIGLARDELIEWCDRYPEFDKACKRAKMGGLLWWERKAHSNANRGASGGQVAMTIFMLKNFGPEDFVEKIAHTGADGGPLALELLLGKLNQPNVIDALPAEIPALPTISGSAQPDDADESAT